jgi:hypothetical protein
MRFIMRNASMIGQALPAIEFPYHELECKNYSLTWPDYEERMAVISHDARIELRVMLDIDATEFAKQYTKKVGKQELLYTVITRS